MKEFTFNQYKVLECGPVLHVATDPILYCELCIRTGFLGDNSSL